MEYSQTTSKLKCVGSPCRIIYTVCGSPPVSLLNLFDYKNWQNHRLRTSDRALVYVQDNHRFLLIDILPEPFAHKISQMKTPQDKQLMEIFARIAEHFIYYQEIIA